MSELSPESLNQLFLEARTLSAWKPQPVNDELIERIYALLRMGPTFGNSHPTRFFFVRTPEAKEQLKPALSPGNVDKTMSAPLTVVVATDPKFYEQLAVLSPARPQMREMLAAMPPEKRDLITTLGGGLEAAYLMLAARALGLDCGPMGGFDREKVDVGLLAQTGWKSQLLVNLGYGDRTPLHPRQPRLPFDVACKIA